MEGQKLIVKGVFFLFFLFFFLGGTTLWLGAAQIFSTSAALLGYKDIYIHNLFGISKGSS